MKPRRGVVLLLALLCLIALEVTAVGLHFIARQELRTAGAAVRDLQLRIAARNAAMKVLRAWPAEQAAQLAVDGSIDVAVAADAEGIISVNATVRRVSADLLLLRTQAVSLLKETYTIGVLVAETDAASLLRQTSAALVAAGPVTLRAGAAVRGGALTCTAATLPAIMLYEGTLTGAGGSVSGGVDTAANFVGGLGPLTTGLIVGRGSSLPVPDITPLPSAVGSSCDTTSASNWGEPLAAVPPCTTHHTVSAREGSLTLTNGRGQGVLAVTGDLVLNGTRFDGLVLVDGSLTLLNGATIDGAAIVGGATIIDDGTLALDGCALQSALADLRLLAPYHPRSRMWIPLF